MKRNLMILIAIGLLITSATMTDAMTIKKVSGINITDILSGNNKISSLDAGYVGLTSSQKEFMRDNGEGVPNFDNGLIPQKVATTGLIGYNRSQVPANLPSLAQQFSDYINATQNKTN